MYFIIFPIKIIITIIFIVFQTRLYQAANRNIDNYLLASNIYEFSKNYTTSQIYFSHFKEENLFNFNNTINYTYNEYKLKLSSFRAKMIESSDESILNSIKEYENKNSILGEFCKSIPIYVETLLKEIFLNENDFFSELHYQKLYLPVFGFLPGTEALSFIFCPPKVH